MKLPSANASVMGKVNFMSSGKKLCMNGSSPNSTQLERCLFTKYKILKYGHYYDFMDK